VAACYAVKKERVELEMKILRYRKLARQIETDPGPAQRTKELIADLEKELRGIDE
jgi:hypothetical protein